MLHSSTMKKQPTHKLILKIMKTITFRLPEPIKRYFREWYKKANQKWRSPFIVWKTN